MTRPIIGVVPLLNYQKNHYWMVPGYLKGLQEAGAMPVMLPVITSVSEAEHLIALCSGFLFTGGQDVNPAVYGEKKSTLCGEISPERDIMEKLLLEQAMAADKPILGICRGIQFINAALGGTLYQDIPLQLPSDIVHFQQPPYHLPSHEVEICPESPLRRLLGRNRIYVNSYHHQGIKELSPQLCEMAYSADGLTEAVYAPNQYFLWAVQWHPEYSYTADENSRKLFRAFIEHC